MLADGTYDVLVVDAEDRPGGRIACDVTILDGEHKGDVVTIVTDLAVDPIDLLALPATLVVTDGEPDLAIDGDERRVRR